MNEKVNIYGLFSISSIDFSDIRHFGTEDLFWLTSSSGCRFRFLHGFLPIGTSPINININKHALKIVWLNFMLWQTNFVL